MRGIRRCIANPDSPIENLERNGNAKYAAKAPSGYQAGRHYVGLGVAVMTDFTTPAAQAQFDQAEATIREYVTHLVQAFRLAEKEVGAMQAKSALTIGFLLGAKGIESPTKVLAVAVTAIAMLAQQEESK